MPHFFESTMSLPLSPEDVFGFFSDATNLERITPVELAFKITTPLPISMGPGTLIDYKLRLFGVPFKWQTKISSWKPPNEFIDVQLRGPYKEWIHTHSFLQTNEGTMILDKVKYRLPLWPFGECAYPMVRMQLERIFQFRQKAIREILLRE